VDRYSSLLSTSIRGIKGLITWKMPALGPIFGFKVNSWRHTPAESEGDVDGDDKDATTGTPAQTLRRLTLLELHVLIE
jgi:hypothetical protein